jgi:hypothetical protein
MLVVVAVIVLDFIDGVGRQPARVLSAAPERGQEVGSQINAYDKALYGLVFREP